MVTTSLNAEPVRVMVTGLGAVTALGSTAQSLWEGVKEGCVAIKPVQSMPMESYQTRLGGEVKELVFPPLTYWHLRGFREPTIDFALKAAEEAIAHSGIGFGQVRPERWGVVIGTCMAGFPSARRWYSGKVFQESPAPELLLFFPPQALAEAIGGTFGLKGPLLSISTACAAGANAIGYGAELIRNGQADVVLAGGSDAFSDVLFAGFNSLESLSPEPASPYSLHRQGLSLGEGSGILVLVREDIAREMKSPLLGQVVAYGLSADGYHPTAPHPEGVGAAQAIRSAIAAAGVSSDQVRYINGHGTGTAKNDPAETKAIHLALGDAADGVTLSSTKSMIGHLLGAAGAVEGIVTLKALQEQIAPPTANFQGKTPECDLDCVPNSARSLPMDVAISNNFAFGGHNACVVFARNDANVASPPTIELEEVVVTGISTLTAAGNSPDAVWNAFVTNQVCTQLENDVQVGRVHLDPAGFLTSRDRRRMDRLGILSVVATQLVLLDAEIRVTPENQNRIGVMFGTGLGPMESLEKFFHPLLEEGIKGANPAIFPNTVYNAAAGLVSIHTGIVGPSSTVTAGHAAGASALCYGYDLVASGQADAMVCIATDTLTEHVILGYKELNLLSSNSVVPFAGHGFALAEGSVALVLERLSSAKARNARIYGQMLGYGIASDSKGVGRFDLRGAGLEQAMKIAMSRSHVEPSDVMAIWANAAGYRPADIAEAAALRRLFPVSLDVISPKKVLGEPIGVGGMLNAALALKAWQQPGYYPAPTGAVLVNSCSLGGTHFSIALNRVQQ